MASVFSHPAVALGLGPVFGWKRADARLRALAPEVPSLGAACAAADAEISLKTEDESQGPFPPTTYHLRPTT